MKKVIFNKPLENFIESSDVNSRDTIIVIKANKSLTFTTNSVKAIYNTDVIGVIAYSLNIKDKPYTKGYVFLSDNDKELPNVLNGESQYERREELFRLLNQVPNVEFYVIPGK